VVSLVGTPSIWDWVNDGLLYQMTPANEFINLPLSTLLKSELIIVLLICVIASTQGSGIQLRTLRLFYHNPYYEVPEQVHNICRSFYYISDLCHGAEN
jgi:hypothetical protein